MRGQIDIHDERAVRECFARSHVLIVGCGGLGSNIAMMLVRSGVGTLTLVDQDRVEASNLNRQNFVQADIGTYKVDATKTYLENIDPKVKITAHAEAVGPIQIKKLAQNCDVIVEAVDSAELKEQIIADESLREGTPVVMGLGVAGAGDANEIRTEKFSKNLFIAGDMATDVRDEPLLLAPRVMLVAAHQALAVLRLLLGEKIA